MIVVSQNWNKNQKTDVAQKCDRPATIDPSWPVVVSGTRGIAHYEKASGEVRIESDIEIVSIAKAFLLHAFRRLLP